MEFEGMDFDEEDQFHFAGDEDEILITSGERLDGLLDKVLSRKTNDRQAVNLLARMRVPETGTRFKPKLAAGLRRLSAISKGMSSAAGKIEADYQRRPNQQAGIYGPNIAPGGTQDFSLTPSGGQAWYRILGLLMTKGHVEYLGFKSLKIGGLEHINAIQTAPTAPIPGAVSAAGFVTGDSSNVWNIAPFTGFVFDNATPFQGTFANMTTVGGFDAVTIAPRLLVPIQTDPCGQSYQNVKATAAQWMGKYRRALAGYYRPS